MKPFDVIMILFAVSDGGTGVDEAMV